MSYPAWLVPYGNYECANSGLTNFQMADRGDIHLAAQDLRTTMEIMCPRTYNKQYYSTAAQNAGFSRSEARDLGNLYTTISNNCHGPLAYYYDGFCY